MRRVVITGMAPETAIGTTSGEFFENLCKKRQVLKKIEKDNIARKNLRTGYCVPFPELNRADLEDRRLKQVQKRGSKSACAAAAAAVCALADAGITVPDGNTCVFMGSGAPTMDSMMRNSFRLDREGRMSAFAIPASMQSSMAAWIAVTLGIHGHVCVVNSACASSTDAIGLGYKSILGGCCDMALCGGSEELGDPDMVLMRGFEMLHCISEAEDGRSAPFSEERSGFLFSEGAAAVLVLEELSHALKRHAEIYAEITGYEQNCDAFSLVSMPEEGTYIEELVKKAVGGRPVQYYNAHATGTELNDLVEANMLRHLFGNREEQPAVSSTKSIIGHTIGASGALEAIACVESILQGRVHGSTCRTVLDQINITAETRNIHIDRALSASFGFGGHNAVLVFERFG